MDNVTVESLKRAGHEDPEKTFREIAVAGGFGDLDPNQEGGLDISGLEGKYKTAVERLLTPADTSSAGKKKSDG